MTNLEPATDRDPNFPNMVATILSLPFISILTCFSLQCSTRNDEQVSSWISAVLGGGGGANNLFLQEFVLSYRNHNPINLPQELLDYASLRKLYLHSTFDIRAPAAGVINFPNLTSLYLHDIRIMNAEDSNTDTLALNLPALKVLELIGCSWGLFKYVEIHAPELSSFDYCSAWRSTCSIKITGARLALDNMSCDCLREAIVVDGSTVDCTRLRFNFPYVKDIPGFRELVKKISHVKHLILSGQTAGVIVRERLAPVYGTIERLEISGYIDIGSTLELLDAMPKLKYLTLDSRDKEEYDYEHVPSCITSYLEEVVFKYRPKLKHLFHLQSFILKNATKLKKVTLFIHTKTTLIDEIVNQISTLINRYAVPTITEKGPFLVYVFRC